jgi:alpha-galactosidase
LGAVSFRTSQLAALNRTNVNVQELTVEAALTGSREALYHAVMLDPLTAAVCTLPQIRKMVDEMLAAQTKWIMNMQ